MSHTSRRTFLKSSPEPRPQSQPRCATSPHASMRPSTRQASCGLQLYSVRELLPKDFDGTLKKLAAAGYKECEAAGYYNKTAAQWKASMDAAGLRCRQHSITPSPTSSRNSTSYSITATPSASNTSSAPGLVFIAIPRRRASLTSTTGAGLPTSSTRLGRKVKSYRPHLRLSQSHRRVRHRERRRFLRRTAQAYRPRLRRHGDGLWMGGRRRPQPRRIPQAIPRALPPVPRQRPRLGLGRLVQRT